MVTQNGSKPSISATSREVGVSGLRVSGGRVMEEFLAELRGPAGVKAYDMMRKNDPMIGAILRATKDTLRSVGWEIEPDKGELKDAEWLLSCMNDMSHTWMSFIDEVLTMIPFGWAYMEVVYKRRDEDARIGWQKVALRGQDSLMRWELDETGGIHGMWQQAMTPTGMGFTQALIPIEKSVLFRTEREKNNPEGYSFLRNAYTAYYKKTNLEEIEAIGAEREATGHLVITPPVGADDTDKAEAQNILERYKVDDQMGFYLPRVGKEEWERWQVDVIKTAGQRGYDLDRIIQRYQGEIAMAFLAQFLRLGQSGQKVGSYALSRDQRDLFHLSIKSIMDNIEETINRYMVTPLMKLNGVSEPFPRIIHGRIGQRDIQTLALYLQGLSTVGALAVDDNLRQFLREEAELPREPAGVDVPEAIVTPPAKRQEETQRSPDRTGEKPRSETQPQDQENRRGQKMVEPEPFELTDEIFAAARKRRDKLYEGSTKL